MDTCRISSQTEQATRGPSGTRWWVKHEDLPQFLLFIKGNPRTEGLNIPPFYIKRCKHRVNCIGGHEWKNRYLRVQSKQLRWGMFILDTFGSLFMWTVITSNRRHAAIWSQHCHCRCRAIGNTFQPLWVGSAFNLLRLAISTSWRKQIIGEPSVSDWCPVLTIGPSGWDTGWYSEKGTRRTAWKESVVPLNETIALFLSLL